MPRILVVDDIPDNIALLTLELEDRGYEVISANDGPTALALARACPPDAILLDLVMPGIDGIEVCRRLKADAATEAIPVLMISSRGNETDVLRALEAGAHDYITKPFHGPIVAARVQTAVRIKEARAAAEAASRSKGAFLANMSHEIRTPLNAILGMTELTLDTPLLPEQRANLEVIMESVGSLLVLIDDILDLSKVEAGMLRLNSVVFEPREQLNSIMKMLSPRALDKGLDFALRIAPETPERLVGDPLRLRQVLVNLVGNAIKFTEQGEVAVIVEPQMCTSERTVIRFRVSDTGIGIPNDQRESIFDPFTQVESSRAQRYGGTGLGLSISHRLVKLMDGEIRALGTAGEGSTFEFTVTFGVAHATSRTWKRAPRESVTTSWPGARILLAEDHPFSERVVVQMLRKQGHTVTVARTGLEAVAAVEHEPFDLVLMDVQMPEMDGIAATRVLRATEGGNGCTIPIVAMTAHAMQQDHLMCFEAGMDDVLVKPIRLKRLMEVIGKQLARRDRTGSSRWVDTTNERTGPPFDSAAALERVDGDERFLGEMAALFVAECPVTLGTIREALENGDRARAYASTHKLQNWANNFHAIPTVTAALALERNCREGDTQAADGALLVLETEIRRLMPVLEHLIGTVQQAISAESSCNAEGPECIQLK